MKGRAFDHMNIKGTEFLLAPEDCLFCLFASGDIKRCHEACFSAFGYDTRDKHIRWHMIICIYHYFAGFLVNAFKNIV